MSEYTLVLKALAVKVNDHLNQYIAVHDRRFKSAATLSSVFRNLIGRGPNFSDIYREAIGITEKFSILLGKLENIKVDEYRNFIPEEKEFFDLLLSYVEALYQTCIKLSHVTEAQERGSNGSGLSWQENRALESKYKESIEKYTAIGSALNDAYHRLA